jgi:replicative DNA helicase
MKQDIIQKIQEIIGHQNNDEGEMIFQLKRLLDGHDGQHPAARESKSINALVAENLEQLNQASNQGNTLKTGFRDFDKEFGGFGLGEFIVIGGRPSMGKTQLLVNLSLNISVEIPVLYFTFDLSEFLLTGRFISSCSGIAINKILQNELTDAQQTELATVGTRFDQHKIFVNDSCSNSFSALKAHCQKQIEENGVKVIVVDYLQMMSSNRYRNNRELEISHISRELKNIARDFNVCVIASSQLNRSVESRGGDKRPMLADLRESGAIEQDADKVIFLYRPEYYGITCYENGERADGVMEMILAKNRNGSLGVVRLLRDENFTKFSDFEALKIDFEISQSRLDEIDMTF